MSLQLLLNEPYVAISYDHLNEWLYADWQGDLNMSSVQQGASEMLHFLVQQRCHKVLNDNRGVTSMWSEAAEWGGKELLPAMMDAGMRYFAWVYSPNIYSRLSTDLTLQFARGNAVIATFDDVETARAWLARV